jgi:hypothetical protein
MGGDVHAAWIGGITGVGRSPVERQQGIECLDFSPADTANDVGQVGFRVDPVQARTNETRTRLCALWDVCPVWDSGRKASPGAGLTLTTVRSRPN